MFPYFTLTETTENHVHTIDATIPAGESKISGCDTLVPDGRFLRNI